MRDESCKGTVSRVDCGGVEEQNEDGRLFLRHLIQTLTGGFGATASLLAPYILIGIVSSNLASRVQEKE